MCMTLETQKMVCVSFTDPASGSVKQGKVAIQVRIKPESYTVSKQTVTSDGTILDKNIPNDELEWSTNWRGVVIPVGIMVKVKPAQ